VDGVEMLVNEDTIAWLTRKQEALLWAQPRMIEPVFVPTILGNGDTLLALSPLNTRPNYYLIRIDSKWLDPENTDIIYDHLDEIYDAIEGHVGPREWEDDDGKEHVEDWPAMNLDCGSSWWDASNLLESKSLTHHS
jgi:hypothetical protein